MALEIKAGDKLDFSKIFPDKPTGKVEEILNGKMSNQYKQEINFHGNRKEILNFLDEILYNFPEKNSLQINFDKETGFESAYISDGIANFKTENLNISEMKEIMENTLDEIYELTIENGNCTLYSVNPDEYTITSKGKTIDKEVVETMIEDIKSYHEPMVITESRRTLEYQVEDAFDTVQSVKFISPSADNEEYIFNYSSSDQNGVESSFVEQVEKAVSKIENFNFKREIEEPYLDENKYRVENYLEEQKNGNLKIFSYPNLENLQEHIKRVIPSFVSEEEFNEFASNIFEHIDLTSKYDEVINPKIFEMKYSDRSIEWEEEFEEEEYFEDEEEE